MKKKTGFWLYFLKTLLYFISFQSSRNLKNLYSFNYYRRHLVISFFSFFFFWFYAIAPTILVVVERLRPELIPTMPDEEDKVRPDDELMLGILGMLGNDDVNCEASDGLKELVKPPDRLPDRPEDACM